MADILFSDKVSSSFVAKVKQISDKLGIDENWLMFVMYNESGLNQTAENPKNCVSTLPGNFCCTGLIQFCVDKSGLDYKTIGGEKVKLSYLRSLSAENQLDYVYKYYKPLRADLNSYVALSLATLAPAYIDEVNNDAFVFPQWVVNWNLVLFKYGSTMRDYKKYLSERVYKIVPTKFYDSFFRKAKSGTLTSETKERSFFRIYRREIIITITIIMLLIALWFVGKKIFK